MQMDQLNMHSTFIHTLTMVFSHLGPSDVCVLSFELMHIHYFLNRTVYELFVAYHVEKRHH